MCESGSGQCAEIFMEKQTLDYVSVFTLPYTNMERKSLIFSSGRDLSFHTAEDIIEKIGFKCNLIEKAWTKNY